MKNNDLYKLFMDELADMYSAENQIVDALPKLIQAASNKDLKDALTKHLKETKGQVERIERIYSILDEQPEENNCEAMEGLIKEADELVRNFRGQALDAAIISAAQKVEHYEMASYGTLRSFAKHLELDSEIADLLQETLDEEGAADKKLTKIADGSLFTSGVNKEAVGSSPKSRR